MTDTNPVADFSPGAWRLISSTTVDGNVHETLAMAVRGLGVLLQTRVTNASLGTCAIPQPTLLANTVICEFTRPIDETSAQVLYRDLMTTEVFSASFEKQVVAGSIVAFSEKKEEVEAQANV